VKIVDIRATPVNIPFGAPYVFSYGSIASLTKTIVEVTTDAGAVGIGEVADGDLLARGGKYAAMWQRQQEAVIHAERLPLAGQ
jgi:L-alanine-DL-glutamate epimerase-like enolase superfamily enzyme